MHFQNHCDQLNLIKIYVNYWNCPKFGTSKGAAQSMAISSLWKLTCLGERPTICRQFDKMIHRQITHFQTAGKMNIVYCLTQRLAAGIVWNVHSSWAEWSVVLKLGSVSTILAATLPSFPVSTLFMHLSKWIKGLTSGVPGFPVNAHLLSQKDRSMMCR